MYLVSVRPRVVNGLGLTSGSSVVLQQRPRHRAVGEAIATAGAFSFENFVHVMNVLHFWMDRAFGTNLTAKAAGDAETLDDSDFHRLLRST
jgi:hypothetical protein